MCSLVALLVLAPLSSFHRPGSDAPGLRGSRSDTVGIAIPGTTLLYADVATLDAHLRAAAATGSRWLRFDAPWTQIETAPGQRDWSNLDRVVTHAQREGFAIDLVLGTVAAWARPPGTDWRHGAATAEQRAGFVAFSTAVATRYRGRIAAYEVWNEPNLPGSWAPAPNAADYLQLLRRTYPALHAADPAAVVLAGGTGGGPTAIPSLSWYRSLYDGGLKSFSDAIAVHPYPDAPAPRSGQMAQAFAIRELMSAHGDGDKPLWGTEVGVPTGGTPSVDEQTQATLVAQLYEVWSSLPRRGPLIYYTLRDGDALDREGYFGLIRADGTAKPAYRVLRSLTIE